METRGRAEARPGRRPRSSCRGALEGGAAASSVRCQKVTFSSFAQASWYPVCLSNAPSQCSLLAPEFLREGKLFTKQGSRLPASQWMAASQPDAGLCACQLWTRAMSAACGHGGLPLGGGCGLGQMAEPLPTNRSSMVGRHDLCPHFSDYISHKCSSYKCR